MVDGFCSHADGLSAAGPAAGWGCATTSSSGGTVQSGESSEAGNAVNVESEQVFSWQYDRHWLADGPDPQARVAPAITEVIAAKVSDGSVVVIA